MLAGCIRAEGRCAVHTVHVPGGILDSEWREVTPRLHAREAGVLAGGKRQLHTQLLSFSAASESVGESSRLECERRKRAAGMDYDNVMMRSDSRSWHCGITASRHQGLCTRQLTQLASPSRPARTSSRRRSCWHGRHGRAARDCMTSRRPFHVVLTGGSVDSGVVPE